MTTPVNKGGSRVAREVLPVSGGALKRTTRSFLSNSSSLLHISFLSVRTGSNNERPSEVFPITLAGESRLCFVWCVGLIPSSSSDECAGDLHRRFFMTLLFVSVTVSIDWSASFLFCPKRESKHRIPEG